MADDELAGLSLEELEKRYADLVGRWPAHSVPPSLWVEREELEEEIERRRRKEKSDS
ncbi:MAG: histidine kinase [Deltaproteobacteria bacterium]|nr:MAG: histidine kinase [Deltaproteobacteria bacterium]